MEEHKTSHARRPSGRDAKRAARAARAGASIPYITRKIPYYEVLDEEGLALMEHNADTILEEIGIDFRDDPEALEIWKAAGADVKGERVHFARGMCRFDQVHQGIASETPSSIEGVEIGMGNSVELVEIIGRCGGKKRADGLCYLNVVGSRRT